MVLINLQTVEAKDLADNHNEVKAQQEEGGRKLKEYCTMWQFTIAKMNSFQVKPRASV